MNKLLEARKTIDEEDKIIREAFLRRMIAVREVISYKKANNLPILDSNRENEIIAKAKSMVKDEKLNKYYLSLIKALMEISKDYQKELLDE